MNRNFQFFKCFLLFSIKNAVKIIKLTRARSEVVIQLFPLIINQREAGLEPLKKYPNTSIIQEKNISTNFSNQNLEVSFQNYNKLIGFCLNASKSQMELNDQIKNCKKFLQDNFGSKDKVFSFSLSLLGQRIHTKLNIEKQKNLLTFLYIFSLLLGAENLSSLDYLIKLMPKEKKLITNSLIENDIFSCLPHNSFQWNKIVNLQRNRMGDKIYSFINFFINHGRFPKNRMLFNDSKIY